MTDSNGRAQIYRFATFEVDVPAHDLRKEGARIRLQDQPWQVLLALLERAGKVVSRDELRQRIWPSSVFVDFDHGLNNAVARLREALGDEAGTPRYIETIPRIGYRFLDKVTAQPDESAAAAPAATTAAAHRGRSRWLAPAAGVAAGLAIALVLHFVFADRQDVPNPDSFGPSIAVLPFMSLSSDQENEFLSDGLTDELVTRLAGIRGLKVVARTSSYRFKGKAESSAAIADALQVNHFLEGSVRRYGDRVRITAQLIDARKDQHVWSQTFDREVGDLADIQEEIALAVAATLKVSLLDAEKARLREHGTNDPEAYRLYLIARAHLLLRTRGADPEVAKRSLDAAIARDPNFAAAYAWLVGYYFQRAFGKLADTEEGARLGIAAADHAVALDPDSSEALMAHANFDFWRYRFRGDYGAEVAADGDMQRALALDPANGVAFEDYGGAIIWHQPDTASSLLERSTQMDLLCVGPMIMNATVIGNRGDLAGARKRCGDILARFPEAQVCDMAIATLETYYGNFDRAVPLLLSSEKFVGGAARIQLWSMYMSAGDRAGAGQWLDFGKLPMERPLSDAARFAMDGRYDQAFEVLDRSRKDFAYSRLLDLPAAKFALLAGKPQQALEILEQRLPDLASGVEPIDARNVLPAIDLATARWMTGAHDGARDLLGRVAAWLDGPRVVRLPLFELERARIHALVGEREAALSALNRAYDEGQRATWAIDLRPQSFLYLDPIEADPAFSALRDDPGFKRWLDRIASDDVRLLRQVQAQPPVQAVSAPATRAKSG